MDALVEAALAKVNKLVPHAISPHFSPEALKDDIVKAINAVDALKSALKAL